MSICPISTDHLSIVISPPDNAPSFAWTPDLQTAPWVSGVPHDQRAQRVRWGWESVHLECLLFGFIHCMKYSDSQTFPLKAFRKDCATILNLAKLEVYEFPRCKRIAWTLPLFTTVSSVFFQVNLFLREYKKTDTTKVITRERLYSACPDIGNLCDQINLHKKENISKKMTEGFSSVVLEFVSYIRSRDVFTTASLKYYCNNISALLSKREYICQFICNKIEWDSVLVGLVAGLCKDLGNFLNKQTDPKISPEALEDFGLNEFCDAIEEHTIPRTV